MEQTSDDSEKAVIYERLEIAKYCQGEYKETVEFYEKSLLIRQERLPPNHPDLANSYNNIGLGYARIGDYPNALSFFERAVDIGQQSLPSHHPHLQLYRKNIDIVKKIL